VSGHRGRASLLADDILDALATIIDPELGMNIVDLGLLYNVQVQVEVVSIAMTTPACPAASHLVDQAEAIIRSQFPTLQHVDIQLVWEPLWNPFMMSWKARASLGWTSIP
jgi:metal-sulfur cluster biosynthetic enzyme